MCGIVGYVGKQQAYPILIKGLHRLEYRGYDSAGLALVNREGVLNVFKSKGKVADLEHFVESKDLDGTIGIAHTRWATHGEPNDINAHPHYSDSGNIALIHNGIIENYRVLKEALIENGYTFKSDTDTEVLVNLIEYIRTSNNCTLLEAVQQALKQVIGAYAIAVVEKGNQDQIIAARRSSPMVIGIGDKEFFLASDAASIVEYTDKIVYVNDGEVVVMDRNHPLKIVTLDNQESKIDIKKLQLSISQLEKGGYPHFMLKEIFEQPETIENAIRGRINYEMGTAILNGLGFSPCELAQISRIVIAACGSSMHAGMVAEYYFEDIAGISTSVEQAAEFRYRNPIIEPNTLVIPISQSGETADTIAAVREAVGKGAYISALCNVVGSTIAREAGRGVYLHAGPEISVASTKAFSSQVAVLLLMALLLGRNRRLSRSEGCELVREIEQTPELIRSVLAQAEEIRAIAKRYAGFDDFFYIGRGCLYPTALEGALKLKEISYVHAEGYHAAELKHGPISLLDERHPVLALANDIPGRDKILGNIQECRARRAPVVAVATAGDREVENLTDDVIFIPHCSRFIAPLPTTVALQLFAYYIAVERGCEIDQPRNLAKSVTVE